MRYGAELAIFVLERRPSRRALEQACRGLKHGRVHLPSIAEVMTALEAAEGALASAAQQLDALPGRIARRCGAGVGAAGAGSGGAGGVSRRRVVSAGLLVALLAATPARAGWSIAYAPGTNLERLEAALLGTALGFIDMAAYVLTVVPVIDALAAAGARDICVRLYRKREGRPARGAAAEALARLAAAPNVEVRFKAHGALMHLKSYLVDGRVLRSGAANFSGSGLKSQDNDRFETDDPGAVAAFRAAFEAAWVR